MACFVSFNNLYIIKIFNMLAATAPFSFSFNVGVIVMKG